MALCYTSRARRTRGGVMPRRWRRDLGRDSTRERVMSFDSVHHLRRAPSRTTIRRLIALSAASALLLSVVGPPVAAAVRPGVGHRSTAKITRVHQTHLAKKSPTDIEEGA